jgi:hypothetical protein
MIDGDVPPGHLTDSPNPENSAELAPRKFIPNSPLHTCLAQQFPDQVTLIRNRYNLFYIFRLVIILFGKFRDTTNYQIFMLNDEFATLFNQKVIDVWELRHLLKSQLVPLKGGEVLLSDTQPRGLIPCRNTYRFHWSPISIFCCTPADILTNFNSKEIYQLKPPLSHILELSEFNFSHPWATNNRATPLNFLKALLRLIICHHDKFLDSRNLNVIIIHKSLLSDVFHVHFLHRTQIAAYLWHLLKLVPNAQITQTDSQNN